MNDVRTLDRNYLISSIIDRFHGPTYISTDAEDTFLSGLVTDALSVSRLGLEKREAMCQLMHSRWTQHYARAYDWRTAALNSPDARQADAMWTRAMTHETLASNCSEYLCNERDDLVIAASQVLGDLIANY